MVLKILVSPLDYIRRHLYWKVFLVLLANLILVVLAGLFISIIFWKHTQHDRIKRNERYLTRSLISYWENYYHHKGYFPRQFDEHVWAHEMNNVWKRLNLNRYRFILGSEALSSIALYNDKKTLIFSFDNHYRQKSRRLEAFLDDIDDDYDFDDDDDDDHKEHQDDDDFDDDDFEEVVIKKLLSDEQRFGYRQPPLFIRSALELDLIHNFKTIQYPLKNAGAIVGWISMPTFADTIPTSRTAVLLSYLSGFFGILLLVIVITALMALSLSRWLLKPIMRINNALQLIKTKDFSVRVKEDRHDELGKLSQSFNLMARQMEEFAHSKKLWIATISHELKTPLTILRGEVEAMIDGVRPANKKQLASLQNELLALTDLTIELQELASFDREYSDDNHKQIYGEDLLDEIKNKYQLIFSQNKLILKLDKSSSATKLLADKNLLKRALDKVMENCLSHSDAGDVRLSCYAKADNWCCEIEDSGPGLSEQERAKIFDYFYRSNDSTSSHKGSGLGLAICHSIVDIHQGKVKASKSSLGGLKISISIPIYK